MAGPEIAPVPLIENRILLIRGEKVLLDSDLAELYGVPTKVFNQAVKRNLRRFPDDFMFRLTLQEGREIESLRSQTVTLKRGGHRKYSPFVFTEQGIAMLSSILNSERAILVNIAIIRTFVRLRQILATHEELARQMEELRWRLTDKELLPCPSSRVPQLLLSPSAEDLAVFFPSLMISTISRVPFWRPCRNMSRCQRKS